MVLSYIRHRMFTSVTTQKSRTWAQKYWAC